MRKDEAKLITEFLSEAVIILDMFCWIIMGFGLWLMDLMRKKGQKLQQGLL